MKDNILDKFKELHHLSEEQSTSSGFVLVSPVITEE
jgi:hypothetical protein